MEIQQKVRELSNDELKNLLVQYGYEPGPVVGTTRRVYENKLVKFVQEAVSSGAASPLNSSSSQIQPTPHLTNGCGDDVVIINGYGEVLEASPKKVRVVFNWLFCMFLCHCILKACFSDKSYISIFLFLYISWHFNQIIRALIGYNSMI